MAVTLEGVTSTAVLLDVGPLAQLRAGRLARRLPQLVLGLYLFGASLAMMVRGAWGLAPWDVLHLGMTEHLPLTLGQAVVLASFVVLLLWIPLREKPGIGTVANAVLVGLSADLTLWLLAEPAGIAGRLGLTVGGVVLCGLGGAMYIGAQLGRGPRDGLMTGLARRTGLSLRLVRTAIEVTAVLLGVVLAGGLLGAGVGLGTALYALGIGPLTQAMLPWFTVALAGD